MLENDICLSNNTPTESPCTSAASDLSTGGLLKSKSLKKKGRLTNCQQLSLWAEINSNNQQKIGGFFTPTKKRLIEELSSEQNAYSSQIHKKQAMEGGLGSSNLADGIPIPENMAWIAKLFENLSSENKTHYCNLDQKIQELSSKQERAIGLLQQDIEGMKQEV